VLGKQAMYQRLQKWPPFITASSVYFGYCVKFCFTAAFPHRRSLIGDEIRKKIHPIYPQLPEVSGKRFKLFRLKPI
jgi:hypothetical protein